MKRLILAAVLMLASQTATAATDFSGRWNFDPGKSQNVGMMAQATVVSTIAQSGARLTVDDHSVFGGRTLDDHTIYDLTGAPAQNVSKMSGTGTTQSTWDGNRLVTKWSNEGALPGSTVVRVETRYLSADGQTMFVESSRTGKAVIVMAFDRAP